MHFRGRGVNMHNISALMNELRFVFRKMWGCSFISCPVLHQVSMYDEQVLGLSCFACRTLDATALSRPLVWGTINLKSNEIIDIYPCWQKEFICIPYNEKLSIFEITNQSPDMLLLALIISKYCIDNVFDDKLYTEYLNSVTNNVSKRFENIYDKFGNCLLYDQF